MAPLIVLICAWVGLGLAGRWGVPWIDSRAAAGRAAFALMFLFTGATHFSTMKHEYVAMIPALLRPGLGLVYLSGALEVAGGLGLLLPATRRLAGTCLILLLLAMFPANVHAALNDIPFRGGSPMSLWLRTPIQAAFVVALWWSAVRKGASPMTTAAGTGGARTSAAS